MKITNPASNQTLVETKGMLGMSKEEFIAQAFEIAFGSDAINMTFSFEEVLAELREVSDTALQLQHETDFAPDV